MEKSTLKTGAWIGGITSIPMLALMYLAYQLTSVTFPPFDLFDWLARSLPGGLITFMIDVIVAFISTLGLGQTSESAKLIEQIMALALFIAIGGVIGGVVVMLIRHSLNNRIKTLSIGFGVGAIVAMVFVGINSALGRNQQLIRQGAWLFFLFAGWGVVISIIFSSLVSSSEQFDDNDSYLKARRVILFKLAAGSAALAFSAFAIGRLFGSAKNTSGAGQQLTVENAPTPEIRRATPSATTEVTQTKVDTRIRDLLKPAPGTRSELTPNEDFYRIDINSIPPNVKESNWALETSGLFNNTQNLTLKDLMEFPAYTQTITLSCISNRIGGDLISTSNWSGLRLRDLVEKLGILPQANSLFIEAVDGFFETVVMDDILDQRTLLVYGMNGETLPQEHGFPLRIYIPNRYGMKQPKWITKITAVEDIPDGYWVVRGWSKEARPQIVSVIDTIATDQPTAEGLIPIGGIAWAGDRGIEKVELQIDDGDWIDVALRTPPLSDLAWVQWRYDWIGVEGRHKARVRATDGNGTLQIEKKQGVHPNGATGYHEKSFHI